LIEVPELARFGNLREKIIDVVNEMLRKYKMPTREMIQDLIGIEIDYVNTNHPDFIGGGSAVAKLIQSRAHKQAHAELNAPTDTVPQDIPPELHQQFQQSYREEEKKTVRYQNQKRQQEEAVEQQKRDREKMEQEAKRREEESKKMHESQQQKHNQTGWFNSLFSATNKKEDGKHSPGTQNHNPYHSGYTATSSSGSLSHQNQNPGMVRPAVPAPNESNSSTSHESHHNNYPANNLQKVPFQVTSKEQSQRSENEVFQMELICELLKSYFKIVKKNN